MSGLPNPAADRSRVAVLCGSVTRAVSALDSAERWYREQGYTVHKPVLDDSRTPQEHAERWYELIAACGPNDVVVICNVSGQRIGEQTNRELEYAFDCAVPMRHFIAQPKERVL